MDVCVIFGAGADHNYNSKIPMGNEFARSLLFGKSHEKEIKDYFRTIFKLRQLVASEEEKKWLPTEFKPATIRVDSLYKASIKKKCALEGKDKKSISEELRRASVSDCDNSIERESFIVKFPNYINQIDGRMHTLIRPRSFGESSFWATLILYAKAYTCICASIFDDHKKDYLSHCSEIHDWLEQLEEKKEDSYYRVVKELKESLGNISIVTTNYTPFAEKTIQLDESEIAYPHGKLEWFEDPYRLEVYDASIPEDRDRIKTNLIFPYIFIQSGVKPIVESKQINEYSKTRNFILNSRMLYICGYSINEDDNHINSLLRERIAEGKETVIVVYRRNGEKWDKDEETINILRRLRLKRGDLECFSVEVIEERKEGCSSPDENEQFKRIIRKYIR